MAKRFFTSESFENLISTIKSLLDSKADDHTHPYLSSSTKYAGSSSAGGSATSAVKLDTTTAGSATQPVYFTGGKPVKTTYTLGANVPSSAKFTDTNTTYAIGTGTVEGTISVKASTDSAATNVAVNGLGSAAYTDSTEYATSSHGHPITDVINLENELDAINDAISGKAASEHDHDSVYYAKTSGEQLANTLTEVKNDVDAFFADATISDAAKDTLKEIQDYITSDTQAAADMTASIASKVPSTRKINNKELSSDITLTASDVGASAPGHTHSYVPLSGGTMSKDATLKFNTYGTRFLTISGNSISADMSNETGGWAGNFASVKDPAGDTTPMLGWYGGASGLTHIYMGGTYSDPYMKMTKGGQFTFKNTPYVGSKTVSLSDHTHTVSHTPAGTVGSKSITPAGTVSSSFTGTAASHDHGFTGTKATISTKYTPAGSVSSSFTGSAVNSGTPGGTTPSTTVASSTHTHEYTPSGSVSQPTFTGTKASTTSITGTTTVYSITAVGSLPSHTYTAPSLTASCSNRCLTLTFSAGAHSFSAGSLPTKGSGVSVATGTHTHEYTPAGTVSKPTFTGTKTSTTSISGTAAVASTTHVHSVTATGSVSSSFTGTEATISTEYTPAGTVNSKSITPAGSVSSTFTGTAASHDHGFTGTAATLTTSTPN